MNVFFSGRKSPHKTCTSRFRCIFQTNKISTKDCVQEFQNFQVYRLTIFECLSHLFAPAAFLNGSRNVLIFVSLIPLSDFCAFFDHAPLQAVSHEHMMYKVRSRVVFTPPISSGIFCEVASQYTRRLLWLLPFVSRQNILKEAVRVLLHVKNLIMSRIFGDRNMKVAYKWERLRSN